MGVSEHKQNVLDVNHKKFYRYSRILVTYSTVLVML